MMHLNLHEIKDIFKPYWLWSTDKPNIARFQRKRYLSTPKVDLLQEVRDLIYQKTGATIDQVCLLTNLAYFGYCVNPISIYFCFIQGKLTHCIAEVTNTPWGHSHPYILKPECIRDNIYYMSFKKELHVSPFLTMDYEYHMRCKYTQDKIIVHIENKQNNEIHFDATLSLNLHPINHKNLRHTLLRFPFMTGRVILGIYWQALRLWLKKIKYVPYLYRKDLTKK